jgi:hypothetical protein
MFIGFDRRGGWMEEIIALLFAIDLVEFSRDFDEDH